MSTNADPAIEREEAKRRRQRLTGIGLMCAAVISFACLDASAKYLNLHMDTMQVVWARYVGAFLLTLVVFNPVSRPGLMKTRRPGLQIVRSSLLLGSTITNYIAFRYLQLDQAMLILFSAPFLVAILAGPMLGEWIGWRRWLAILAGFAGVFLVMRPGTGLHWAALASALSAVFYAFYMIITRILSSGERSDTTLFYSNLVGALAMMPVLPFVWSMPGDPFVFVLMAMFGAFGSFGHYLLILAHRLAPASSLAPFMYTQLLWATLAGFLVFGDVPNRWTLAGAAIVIASGLYLLHRERVTGTA